MAPKKTSAKRKVARKPVRRNAPKTAPRTGASKKRASARQEDPTPTVASIDEAFDALFARGEEYRLLCVGLRMDRGCCDTWNGLQPPDLGDQMVELVERYYPDKLDRDEKELLRRWPEHQLLAFTRAIQSVCAKHNYVHPALTKEKRKGPHGVTITIIEPDPALPPNEKRAPVKVVLQHPDFRR